MKILCLLNSSFFGHSMWIASQGERQSTMSSQSVRSRDCLPRFTISWYNKISLVLNTAPMWYCGGVFFVAHFLQCMDIECCICGWPLKRLSFHPKGQNRSVFDRQCLSQVRVDTRLLHSSEQDLWPIKGQSVPRPMTYFKRCRRWWNNFFNLHTIYVYPTRYLTLSDIFCIFIQDLLTNDNNLY